MCFGKKDDIQDDLPSRPVEFAPSQPTYAPTSKASIPSPTASSPTPQGLPPSYYQQQQQQVQSPIAELASPLPAELSAAPADDVEPPSGPPPSSQQRGLASDDFAAPMGPPPSQQRGGASEYAPPPGPPPSAQADYAAPPGPPPSQATYDAPSGPPPSHAVYDAPSGPPPSRAVYDAPPGPPPSSSKADYSAPPGPPPSQGDYSAPPGPPPSKADYTAPPPGPPPSKPEHDWEVLVPDTSLFPPPPDIFSGWDRSPAANATEAEAEAGERWCEEHPMLGPTTLSPVAVEARRRYAYQLMQPQEGFKGTLDWAGAGVWKARTAKGSPDSCVIAFPPLYSVTQDSPLALRPSSGGGVGGRSKTVYYEVRIMPDSRAKETSLAIGFTALPYPSFRLPGWHRGSVGVHGDDGHRYVNDRWGGKSFAEPMKKGSTYGLGITFAADPEGRLSVDIFFTKDGREAGRWNLHEETDADQDLPVTGLEGFHDLSCAVGVFDAVSFEVVFDPAKWLYKGVPA